MSSVTDISLVLHNHLLEQTLELATAESCTGGMIAAALTDHAGSSAYLDRGFVTYSNQSKQEMLGVSALTLDQYGAVSEQTAAAMASGATHNSNAKISLSVTGIAGPEGGSPDKPVGTVCFGWTLTDGRTETETCQFNGDRHAVREQAAAHAMAGLLSRLCR